MMMVSDQDRIMFGAYFSDQDRIRILLKFFGSDRIIKFQYPHNTDLEPNFGLAKCTTCIFARICLHINM